MELNRKMSHRMRSWYLYEQYKELERNQEVAAEQLREKVDQDRILRQELNERRERRRLCSDSPSDLHQLQSDRSFVVTSDHSFYYQLQDDDLLRSDDYPQTNRSSTTAMTENIEENTDYQQTDPNSPSIISAADEEYEDLDTLNADSMSLVDTSTFNQLCLNVLNGAGDDNDIEEKLQLVKSVIKDNMNLQLDTVRDNMKCFEQFTRMRTDSLPILLKHDDIPLHMEGMSSPERYLEAEYDSDSLCSNQVCLNNCRGGYNNNFSVWSKLVSFAYQLVQLNHGNFYYDYGAQFLTAVLACDVLRRGLTRMCDILQRFTCPIKYLSDPQARASKTPDVCRPETSGSNRKSSVIVENMNNKNCPSVDLNTKLPSLTWSCKTSLKNIGRCDSNDSGIYEGKVESYFSSKRNSDVHPSTIWPEDNSARSELNSSRTHHTNPMLKLADIINDSL